MKVLYAPNPFSWTGWHAGTLDEASNTMTIVEGGEEKTFSMQPGGVYGSRDLGTHFQYEVYRKSGNNLIFEPAAGEFDVVPFIELPQ